VARLAFVAAEGKNPRTGEPSIPPYLVDALNHKAATGRVLTQDVLRPYLLPNYETQQPSLYYSLAAPLVHLLPRRTQLGELFLWRLVSLLCAVVAVVATGTIGWRVAGARGVLAAALIVALPTWETLVMRAGNDALACAAIAVAFAISFAAPRTRRGFLAEGLAWGIALAVKLYAWPAAVALLPLWRSQRAPKARWITVMGCGALAVALTVGDLAVRTRNPVGLFAFDAPASAVAKAVPIAWGEVIKIFVATAAWTSGPHNDALRPVGIVLYLAPLALLAAWGAVARRREPVVAICAAAAAAFALAQVINLAGYVRQAHAAGEAMPAGGKEGWYWYALAPLFVGALLAVILRDAPRWLILAVVLWIAGWDLFLTEGALFGDWAGLTGPLHGGAWVRWGPRVWVTDPPRLALRMIWLAAVGTLGAGVFLNNRHVSSVSETTQPSATPSSGNHEHGTDTFPRHR
jgi:hypothetical protein